MQSVASNNSFKKIKNVGVLDENKLLVQPLFSVPSIDVVLVDDDGVLEMGMYQFGIQYANYESDAYTSVYGKSNPVSIFESKIFSHTCKDNTILKTLKKALKEGVNLGYVDLSGANLINANFSGADLTNANFSGANFRDADLCNADLCNADLRNVNLCRANLINANFSGADLSGADLTNAKITDTKLPIYSKWGFSIENESLNIGCKTKTFSEWKEWFEKSEEEFSTERNTEDFKRIQAMFYAYEAYYNFLKS